MDELSKQERGWAAFAHAGGPIGIVAGFGLLGFVIPLAVWVTKKDESPFVERQAKEALNFQITLFAINLAGIVVGILTFGIGFCFLGPILVLLVPFELFFGVLAAVQAYDGRPYRYPLCARFV
jgi:hypothetical protein